MSQTRFTEEFVRLVALVEELTAGDPKNLRTALAAHPNLGSAISSLSALSSRWTEYKETSPSKRVVQAHPEFLHALEKYDSKWSNALFTKMKWERGVSDEEADREWHELVLGLVAGTSKSDEPNAKADSVADYLASTFFPDTDSASEIVHHLFDSVREKGEYEPFFSKSSGALSWFTDSVGLDYSDIEQRWKEFPTIIVKTSVSNLHGLNERKSLYVYLESVRRAYVFGADLAALAMCRSITEILIRHHFNDESANSVSRSAAKKKKIPLGALTKYTVGIFPALKRFNLGEKIVEANELMHFNRDYDAEKWANVQTLVRNWFLVLNEIIDMVPNREIKNDQ